ncbi:TetR/AcrR family transcriptional regulator [Albibacterium indicum]|uniref:TetR/AcrR family transcriptional regulator n=1 Tax=Albibacterium indicum TaxID=2292082 RepID=UPI000E4EA770|nr:TetR/AcrR family transcriptional regulator [Pedobacter indicus]
MEADKIKECIKDSARELFRRYGYNKTNVNEIAKKAKIAKATIYKYFDSKELILHGILMDYIRKGVNDLIYKSPRDLELELYLSNLILKVSRLTYTICNEFIGWDFIRESANAQEYLKTLSDDLENLLVQSFQQSERVSIPLENLIFLVKSSKSIVFSFAFTSVSVADVRKNFVSFQNDLLPFLVKGALV